MNNVREFHRKFLERADAFLSGAKSTEDNYEEIHSSLMTAVKGLVKYLDAKTKDGADAVTKDDFKYNRFHYWIEQLAGPTPCGQQTVEAHNAILNRQTFMASSRVESDLVRKIYTLYVLLQLSMIGKLTLWQQDASSVNLQAIVRDFQIERRYLLQQLLAPIKFYETSDCTQADFVFVGFKTEQGIKNYLKPSKILGFIDFATTIAAPKGNNNIPKESSKNQPKCSDKLDEVQLTFTDASYYEYGNNEVLKTCGGETQAALMTGDNCKYKRLYRFSPTMQLWVLSCVVVMKRREGKETYCLPIACKDVRKSDAALSRIIAPQIKFVKEGRPFQKSDHLKLQLQYFDELDAELGVLTGGDAEKFQGPRPPNNKLATQVNKLLLANSANVDPGVKQFSTAIRNVGQMLARFGLYYSQYDIRTKKPIPVAEAGYLLPSVVIMTLEHHLPASEFLGRELAKMIKTDGRIVDCAFDDMVQKKFIANMLAQPQSQYYITKALRQVTDAFF